jgi:hypothetical protein
VPRNGSAQAAVSVPPAAAAAFPGSGPLAQVAGQRGVIILRQVRRPLRPFRRPS